MRWGLTPTSDAIPMTAKRGDFSPRFFRPRAFGPGAPNFYYTMPPAICQEKRWKKLYKIIILILCILPIAIRCWVWYNTLVNEG